MTFKCKMCGGDIEPIKGTNTGKCLYCKSIMTLPNIDNERIVNLYNRANDLRLNNEFDKSKEIYETILKIDNNETEAHWGILLCKYGVEYVDDPKTKTKIPTCHRTSDYSILLDNDFKYIKKNSYGEALKLYEKEAKQIDDIQKNILSISSKEKPYDVFICYKETDKQGNRTHDSVIAEDIYDKLTNLGFKVFFSKITLENKLGKEYEPYIYSALKTSKVMLVVGTSEENFSAVWVKNEWSRFLEMMHQDKSKVLIPVYSKIDAYKLPEEFAMLQAQSMDKVGAMQDLTRGVKKIIEETKVDDIEGIDKETIAKVQNVLDEAKNLGNGRYEVTVLKEKLPTWYYVIVTVLIFIGSNIYLSLAFAHYSNIHFNNVWPLFVSWIFFAVSYFFIFKRKSYKYKNILITISFLLTFFQFIPSISAIINNIVNKEYNFILPIIQNDLNIIAITSLIYIIEFILLFINPSWTLNSSTKSIMNAEEKDRQLKKNKYIKENFKTKEKSKGKIIKIIFAITLILYIAIHTYSSLNTGQPLVRDKTKDQIIIVSKNTNDRFRIYLDKKRNLSSGRPTTESVFTVLEVNKNKFSDKFYKVKTNYASIDKSYKVGYIYEKNSRTDDLEVKFFKKSK